MFQSRMRAQRPGAGQMDREGTISSAREATAGNRALVGAIQTKLEVGPAGDRYEREADSVAKSVVSSLGAAPTQRQPGEEELMMSRIQRQGIEDEELLQGKWLQRQSIEDEELMMSRISRSMDAEPIVGAEGGGLDAATESAISSARSGGRGLDAPVRREMESAFGVDFSGVRVHTGQQADSLNSSMQARAFTTGSDMFIRSSDYSPGTRSGKELIAHELTHVVQQGAARSLEQE